VGELEPEAAPEAEFFGGGKQAEHLRAGVAGGEGGFVGAVGHIGQFTVTVWNLEHAGATVANI
jgi:hypothetical protein